MVNVKFFPVDIDFKNGIRLFGETVDGKKVCVIDNLAKPYFYVIPKEGFNIFNLQKKIESIKFEDAFVVSTDALKKRYLTYPVNAIKVYVNNPDAVKQIKDLIKDLPEVLAVKEADINFYKKYLIDRQITPLTICEVEGNVKTSKEYNVDFLVSGEVKSSAPDVINPKILAFDIEVKSSAPSDYSEPIIALSFADNFGLKKVLTWKSFRNPPNYVEILSSEGELIQRFKEIISESKCDILVGYYSDAFDFPYLEARAKANGIALDLGLDRSNVKIKKSKDNIVARIKGIVHVDLFKFIRRVMSGELQLDSYSLDFVAKEMLGEGKTNYDLRDLRKHWEAGNLKELCEYNLNDSNITLKLAEKLLPNLIELVKLTSMPLFDVSRMSYGQLVETYLIKKAHELNEIVPEKPNYNELRERINYSYKGAYVMEPVPGLYRDIVIFDFRSLYPTVIVAKNICPSTLNDNEGNKTPEIDGRYYYFNDKREGFIPAVVKDLILRRKRVKELMKDDYSTALEARSYALKTIANSLYGYMGFFGARYYSRECASSITAFARDFISNAIEDTKKEGFNVLYSDTDSVAFTLGTKKEEDALTFLKKINSKLPDFMELELDGFYPYGIFVSKKGENKGAKKKYALVDYKGNIEIRGFETVRRDWSLIARGTQKKLLEIALKERSKESALDYVKTVITRLKRKEVPIDELVIQTQLKMNINDYEQIGPHVAVAKKMLEKGLPVKQGSAIWFVIAEGKGLIRDRAKIPEDCKEGEYDVEYYINNQIIPAVEKIMEVLGYTKEDLLVKEQSTLSQF